MAEEQNKELKPGEKGYVYPSGYREGQPMVYYTTLSDGPGKGWIHNEEFDYENALKELDLYPVGSMQNQDQELNQYGTPSTKAKNVCHVLGETFQAVFDISGGNCANTTIPYFQYQKIKRTDSMIWGYSDLTTVFNAIYAKSAFPSVLYQTRHLTGDDEEAKGRRKRFQESAFVGDRLLGASDVFDGKVFGPLFDFSYSFLRIPDYYKYTLNPPTSMEGILVGGNARCFLKLAGTPYMPDLNGKILLLEALGGDRYAVSSYFAQLSMMGVFDQVAGILLGTFTHLEKSDREAGYIGSPMAYSYLSKYVPVELPVAFTEEIGHDINSKAIIIGSHIRLEEGKSVQYLPVEKKKKK